MEFKILGKFRGRSKSLQEAPKTIDMEGMAVFQEEVRKLGLKDVNPLDLTGEDKRMWELSKKEKITDEDKDEFIRYFKQIEHDPVEEYFQSSQGSERFTEGFMKNPYGSPPTVIDKIPQSFGISRFLFSKHIYDQMRTKE